MSATFHAETRWRRRVGVAAQVVDQLRDLVDVLAGRRGPRAPLVAVDRSEVAVGVGPLVPDRDAAVLQPLHVGVAAEEPQQLGEDRPGVDLLGGDQREAGGQVEAHLVAEDGAGAGAGPIALLDPLVEDPVEEIEVDLHGPELVDRHRSADHRLRVAADPDRVVPPSVTRSTWTRPVRPITVPWAATYDVGRTLPASHCARPALRLPVTGSSVIPEPVGHSARTSQAVSPSSRGPTTPTSWWRE